MSSLPPPPDRAGQPGGPAARFDYPVNAQNTNEVIPFNYKDTIEATWEVWAANNSETTMQLFYWSPNMTNNAWKTLPQTYGPVPVNGTKAYNLDLLQSYDGVPYFLAQFNLNFTRTDNSPTTGLTLSQQMNITVNKNSNKPGQTYGLSASSTPSPTSASNLPTATVTVDGNSSPSASNTAAAGQITNNASSSSGGISGGAIAGIVIGVIAACVIAAAAVFYFLRRRSAARNNGASQPPPAISGPMGQQPYNHQGTGMGAGAAMYGAGAAEKGGAPGKFNELNGAYAPQYQQQELPANNIPRQELPTTLPPQEMPANSVHHQSLPPQELPADH